jgi:hypothetical protein
MDNNAVTLIKSVIDFVSYGCVIVLIIDFHKNQKMQQLFISRK